MSDTMKTIFLVDSHHGVYIPQIFAEHLSPEKWGLREEDTNILLDGPDNELYWETWEDVLSNAHRQDLGFTLDQVEGDLYAISDDITEQEYRQFNPEAM